MLRTAGSSLTTNIYGHCATSVAVETGKPIGRQIMPLYSMKNVDMKKVKAIATSQNSLSPPQKLYMALAMAESIQELHGDKDGVIVNDDIYVTQWLLGTDGNLKLNDFNNARIMSWNYDRQDYCPFRGKFALVTRPPEYLNHTNADESADIHTLGTVFYSLLTGLLPYYQYYQTTRWSEQKRIITSGEIPYIDVRYRNRTMIEDRLIQVMESCWDLNPQNRASIFTIVQELRDTASMYEQQQQPNGAVDRVQLMRDIF
jgi:hypothetical protein